MLFSLFCKVVSHLKIISILLFPLFFLNCAGTLEEDLKKLDQIYGYCDNPQRNLRGLKYDTCKAKERAAGPDGKVDDKSPLSFDELVEKFTGGPKQTLVTASVNPYLWRSSLETVEAYDLKIADNQGGFIQTEWIYESNEPNKRCIIKIQINSIELVSDGVQTTIKCEEKIKDNWQDDGSNYFAEEKKLILRILELASRYSSGAS